MLLNYAQFTFIYIVLRILLFAFGVKTMPTFEASLLFGMALGAVVMVIQRILQKYEIITDYSKK